LAKFQNLISVQRAHDTGAIGLQQSGHFELQITTSPSPKERGISQVLPNGATNGAWFELLLEPEALELIKPISVVGSFHASNWAGGSQFWEKSALETVFFLINTQNLALEHGWKLALKIKRIEKKCIFLFLRS
jgi:hypothetical protein